MKAPVTVMAACVLLLAGGCGRNVPADTQREVPRNVRVLTLAAGTVNEYFEVSGPVAPVQGTDLSAEENGPVAALPVAKGAAVREGDTILEQERSILRSEAEAADAALAAQAYNIDKVRQLHEAGKVSRIELLTAESAFAQARAAAEVAGERYRRAAVRAPYDGIVADRFVELGQLVAAGTPVVRIIDPYTLKLEAYLTEQQVGWVAPGTPASVQLAGAAGEATGTVTWVGFEADRLTGKFKIEIRIPNPDLVLRSGVIGRARLGKNVVQDAVVIPRDAILNGRVGPAAYVVEQDRAVLRQLTLGPAQGLMVVVREGLQLGDQLVVRGQRDLREGGLVQVTEVAETADGSLAGDPAVLGAAQADSRVRTAAEPEAGR